MIDPTRIKLGKKAPRIDRRTLKLARYLKALPPAPPSSDWTGKVTVPWGMMKNDSLGDCTCAAAGHLVLGWSANASVPVVISDDDILALYEKACGYNPADPSTDQGGVEIDVLNYWRANGIGTAGHQIAAYASVNPKNAEEVQQAIDLFGGIYTGVALPTSAQSQTGSLWDVTASTPGDAGSWGGHAIPMVAYDPASLTCVTWGALQQLSWAWFAAYCDEAYAIITQDWLEANGQAPSGFDTAQLQADLAQLT